MSSYANIPNIKEQTGWRVSFWFAVSSPLVDVPLGFLGSENASRIQRPDMVMDFVVENTTNLAHRTWRKDHDHVLVRHDSEKFT
jgi:hypothetical protein